MTPFRPMRALLGALLLLPLAGCAAVGSLRSAAAPLATYELQPAPGPGGGGGRSLVVDEPTAAGALGTERIVIKPNPLQVAYLPGARWVDPVPRHVQSLLVRSIARSGRAGFVSMSPTGPLPDYVLLTDIEAFQAEVGPPGGPPFRVVTRLTLSLLRDADGRIVASRAFQRTEPAAGDDALTIVVAFNRAMAGLLAEAADWTVRAMAGRPGV